ncbi:MAG: plastocyanin/azurin family copper-binding protein [Chloroflexota bacterium]
MSLVLAATGCAGTASTTPTPSVPPAVTVILEESAFVPPGGAAIDGVPALTIPVGTTVIWTNRDAIDHTATEYLNGFSKPDARFDLELTPGANGSYTFDEAGTYEVGCVPHPPMQMLVIVEEAT